MKKNLLKITLLGILLFTSCTTSKVKIIAPSGTPALALANFHQENKDLYQLFDVKGGSDPLVAAFKSGSHDIIVAPTNLGAKMYNMNLSDGKTPNYVLYQTIVWGNLYVVTTEEVTSFTELSGKEITLFGKDSTPDIVMQSLFNHYQMDKTNFTYTDDVATANAMLKTNKAKTIVSAQPSLSKIISSVEGAKVFDLQNEYGTAFGVSSYPQASIFVKNSLKDSLKTTLTKMTDSVNKSNENVELTAENAVKMDQSFATLGKETLVKAIPNCHFGIDNNQKQAIESYFTKMGELGFADQYGGTLPDENFYYSF